MNYSNRHNKMLTTQQLVEHFKERTGITSMYGVAKRLEIPESTVQGWCKGRRVMTDESALQIAEILDLPTEWVILSLAAERAISKMIYPELAKTANRFTPEEYSEISPK